MPRYLPVVRPLVVTGIVCAVVLVFGQRQLKAQKKTTAEVGPGIKLFREQIRPILTGKCLNCHRADKRQGKLDLSRRGTALSGGENGVALAPGKPEESLLFERVAAGEMPPQNPLSPEQIAAFKAWIAVGAPYEDEPLAPSIKRAGPDWWSLQPIKRGAVPQTPFDNLAAGAIDHFIFEQLAAKKLKPSPPADRLALLRRLSVDLTGLPPTPEEVAAYLADESPQAYENVVDRLLASPAYGERWGRHWLDIVRYGESHGYEQNHLRPNAWPYRDYVIRAFNSDKPYTQFVTEQLAGDRLGDREAEVATGFLVAGVHDTVGIQTVEGTLQQRSNDLDDMVSTIGAAFLGLSVNCAKCHDHKFDPILQKDYYRLTAVVAGVRHSERPLSAAPSADVAPTKIAEAQSKLRALAGEISDLDALARAAVLRTQGVNPVPRPAVNVRRNVDDFAPVTARYLRFTVLATQDGAEPCIDEIEIYGADRGQNLASAARGAKATASSLLPGYPIHQIPHLNDGRLGNSWSWISGQRASGWVQIELPAPAAIERVVWSRDGADEKARYNDRLAARYRIEVSSDGVAWQKAADSEDRAASSEAIPRDTLKAALSPEQQERRAKLSDELARLTGQIQAVAPQSAYIGQFTAPDPVFVLIRGDVMQRGDPVPPGGLSEIAGLSPDFTPDAQQGEPARRLALAMWITDPKHPLTARVMANRLWQYHFGRGIVGTPSDFGFGGELPTHPALLDWLAGELIDGGWRLKRMHKLIVMSYAYRQSSAAQPEGMALDAGNQLLWRMPLRRMEGESIRDSILAVSGKLDRRMGGPGFRLFKYQVVNVAIYEPLDEHPAETFRRSVYQQAARAQREELLANFDCPECAQRAPRRDVTTTPLQALSLLHGSFVVQQASFLAARLEREAGADSASQVDLSFRLAFGRSPTPAEQISAAGLVRRHGLSALCRALFNANEFLYY